MTRAWAITISVIFLAAAIAIPAYVIGQNDNTTGQHSTQIAQLAAVQHQLVETQHELAALNVKLCASQNELRWQTRRFIGKLTVATPYPPGVIAPLRAGINRANAIKRAVRADAEMSFESIPCRNGA